ncbi:MAG: hypothetical protein ACXAC2_15840, partial [Candidatus Kariarchaeaceae archaeon]
MPFDYRIDGTVISVLDLISTVCNDAASDYYIELVPVRVANLVYKIIKVRSVLRTSQPSTNFISQYINSIDNYVGRYSGAELRNDFNNKVVLGGNKQIIWQCEYNSNPPQDLHESCLHQAQLNHIESADDTITPFWGTKSNGDVILTKLDLKGSWEFDLETATINLSLKTLSLRVGTVAISEDELKAVLRGYDSWLSYIEFQNTDIAIDIELRWILDTQLAFRVWTEKNPNKLPVRDLWRSAKGIYIDDIDIDSDRRKIFKWILHYAEEYYGKRFMVRLPNTCVSVVEGQIFVSESPINAGWSEDENVIGLANPSIFSDFFRNDDDTFQAFARFDSFSEPTGNETPLLSMIEYLLPDQYVFATGKDGDGNDSASIWVKADILPDIYFADVSEVCSPRAVIEFSTPVYFDDPLTTSSMRKLDEIVKHQRNFQEKEGIRGSVVSMTGKFVNPEDLRSPYSAYCQLPNAAAVPMYSHINKYGPWFTNNAVAVGPPGNTDVEVDEDLVPWTYGGLVPMSAAAQNIANAGTNNMREGETGDITVAGYPTIPLGAELGSVDGIGGTSVSYFVNRQYLLENRNISFGAEKHVRANQYPANFAVFNLGTWNARTNEPYLESSEGTENNFYTVDVAGTTPLDDENEWNVGDLVIYHEGEWRKAQTENINNYFVNSNSWTGIFGPNITNISFSIGQGGITTTYSLRTFTPTFGRFNKLNADRIKRLSIDRKNRNKNKRTDEYLRGLIDKRIKHKEKKQKEDAGLFSIGDDGRKGIEVITASKVTYLPDTKNFQRDIISQKPILDLNADFMSEEFSNRAIMSLDGLVRPISVDGEGNLPQYYHSDISGSGKTSSKGAQPPVENIEGSGILYGTDIDIDYLNPVSNPANTEEEFLRSDINERHDGDAGHDIDIIGRGTRD